MLIRDVVLSELALSDGSDRSGADSFMLPRPQLEGEYDEWRGLLKSLLLLQRVRIYCLHEHCRFGSRFSKKDRAAFAGGPSQGGNALGRAATAGGYRSALIFRMEKPRALTDLNFDRAGD